MANNNINYNPNLPPNDCLEPWEIENKIAIRNIETRNLARKAYETGGVPPSAAKRTADHSAIARKTPEAMKACRDARTWWEAKNESRDCDGNE
jgi:hypothetical protein